jgi:hypothetical protein
VGPDLSLAHALADAADAISLGRFRARDLVVRDRISRFCLPMRLNSATSALPAAPICVC